jgi:hypothetical protein
VITDSLNRQIPVVPTKFGVGFGVGSPWQWTTPGQEIFEIETTPARAIFQLQADIGLSTAFDVVIPEIKGVETIMPTHRIRFTEKHGSYISPINC